MSNFLAVLLLILLTNCGDGGLNSPPNKAPIARISPRDTTLHLGDQVSLDGSTSIDPNKADQAALRYRWTKLQGPEVVLKEDQSVQASFTPGLTGEYEIRLIVTDPHGKSDTVSATIGVVVRNESPMAVAAAQSDTVQVGTEIQLDGSRSTDPDEADRAQLSYQWSQLSGPSSVDLDNDAGQQAAVTPQRAGEYEFQLVVTDPQAATDTTTVIIQVIVENKDIAGSFFIHSANDLEALRADRPNPFSIADSLVITGTDLSSLEGLNNLTSIGASLVIENNADLESLAGLANLASIGGSLVIKGNAKLTDLNGLDSLSSVGDALKIAGDLEVFANSIQALATQLPEGDFPPVVIEQRVDIGSQTDLDLLRRIGGDSFSTTGSIFISGPELENLRGLENLTRIGGSLGITGNGALANLAGLDRLAQVENSLFIGGSAGGNPSLADLEGLHSLVRVGRSLILVDNRELSSLEALRNRG